MESHNKHIACYAADTTICTNKAGFGHRKR
jgi:hypothetical protein